MRYIPMSNELRISVEEHDDNSYTLRSQRMVWSRPMMLCYWETMHTLRAEINGECDSTVIIFAMSNFMFNVYSEPV